MATTNLIEKESIVLSDYNFQSQPEGMQVLESGYVDYAREVITSRALPDMLDGLKPVNRRLLYASYETIRDKNGKHNKVKSNTLVGSTIKYHPHGDASIYDAMVLMTDKNGSLAVPLFNGQGNFGRFDNDASDMPAAASRYTEVALSDFAESYFGEMDAVPKVPTEDASGYEPAVLPVNYPAVLCNAISGIAVGFSTKLPSFNFNDVIDLTLEYIREGKCSTVIAPDFVNGGYYIRNNKELEKLMRVGSAKLKLRGKMEVYDKTIDIKEVPAGVTLQAIKRQVDKANIASIRGDMAYLSDRKGTSLTAECSSKNRVDETVMAIYKYSDMQTTFHANMMCVLNGVPMIKGVWGIVEEWVKWRRQVVVKHLENMLPSLEESLKQPRAFLEILKKPECADEVVNLIHKVSDEAAVEYILANYDSELIDESLAKWIVGRRVRDFRTGGKYKERLETLEATLNSVNYKIAHPDEVISAELTELKAKYGAQHPRKTEVSTTDYDFVADETGEVVKDTNICQYTLRNGFLSKVRGANTPPEGYEYHISGNASDILIAIDNRGRVLRVYCEDIPYNTYNDLGTYLPRYMGFDERDDYRIWWIGKMDGTEKMIVYTDGTVGFLDTAEWTDVNRKVKVLEKGISLVGADKVGMVLDEIPEVLYITTNKGRLCYTSMDVVKHKDRTARTRVFNVAKDEYIDNYACMTYEEASLFIINSVRYQAPKPQFIPDSSHVIGDVSKFKDCYGENTVQ